jgi:hypothetical protein
VSEHNENSIKQEGGDKSKPIELNDRQMDLIADGATNGRHIPEVTIEMYRAGAPL